MKAQRRQATPPMANNARGFTLVEVLVALTILSVIAVMTWRGVAIMLQAQQDTQAYTDDVLALQAGLEQWQADLDAMLAWPQAPDGPDTAQRSLDWDGRVLRISRGVTGDAGAGALVVAWSRSAGSGAWRRWQSTPVRTQSAWLAAWQAAARWAEAGAPETGAAVGGNGPAVTIARALDWRLHYFQDDAWSNPLSSASSSQARDDTQASQAAALPDAVRLIMTLAPGQAISGPLTLDWVRPDLGGDNR